MHEKKFSGKKVLVAEDYPINQEVSHDILQIFGCEVDIAENGSEVLEKYRKNSYDIIFMDIQMPEKDGYIATQEIRELEKGSKKKSIIVAMTANALLGDREKCLQAGMDDYIGKPIEISKIKEILEKYLH